MASRPLERPWWQLTTSAWLGLAIGLGGIALAVVLLVLLQEPVAWYQLAVAGFWAVVGPGFLVSASAQLVRERRLARSAADRPAPLPQSGDDSFVPVPIRPAGLRRRDERPPTPEGPVPDDPTVQDHASREPVAQDLTAQELTAQDPTAQDPTAQDPAPRGAADPSARTDTLVRPAAPGGRDATGPAAIDPTPTTGPVLLPGRGRHAPMSFGSPTAPAPPAPPTAPAPPVPLRVHAAPDQASRHTTDPLTHPDHHDPDHHDPDHHATDTVPAPRGRHSAPPASRTAPPPRAPTGAQSRGARHRSPSSEEEPSARHGAPRP